MHQVIAKTFNLLDTYLQILARTPSLNPLNELSYFEKMLTQLLDKFADPKSTQKVKELYLRMFTIEQID